MEQELSQEQQQAAWNEEAAILETPAENRPEPINANPEPVAAEPAVPEVPADPYAGLPDAVREKLISIDKMADRMRNLEGSIGGLNSGQRQIRDMLAASQQAARHVAEAPTQSAVKAALVTPEKWSALKADFPEWSDAVESYVESRVAGSKQPAFDPAEIDRRVEARLAGAAPALRREMAKDVLESQFEGWENTVRTPEFSAWLGQQPDSVRALAASDKVSDAAKLLRGYTAPVDPGQAIKDRRAQQLGNAASLPKGTKAAPVKSVDDMNETELWAYEAAQRNKAKAQRGF